MGGFLGNLLVRIGADIGSFTSSMMGAQQQAASAATGITESMALAGESVVGFAEKSKIATGSVVSAFGGLAAVIGGGALLGMFANMVDKTKEQVEEFDDLARATGMTITSLASMKATFQDLSFNAENLPQLMTKLSRSIIAAKDGNTAAIRSFNQLGVSVKDLGSMDVQQIMLAFSRHMANSSDSTRDLGAVSQLAGRNVYELVAALKEGPEVLQTLFERNLAYGQSMENAAAPAAKLTEAQSQLTHEMDKFKADSLPYIIKGLLAVAAAFKIAGTAAASAVFAWKTWAKIAAQGLAQIVTGRMMVLDPQMLSDLETVKTMFEAEMKEIAALLGDSPITKKKEGGIGDSIDELGGKTDELKLRFMGLKETLAAIDAGKSFQKMQADIMGVIGASEMLRAQNLGGIATAPYITGPDRDLTRPEYAPNPADILRTPTELPNLEPIDIAIENIERNAEEIVKQQGIWTDITTRRTKPAIMDLGVTWHNFGRQMYSIFDNVSDQITDLIMQGGKFGDVMKSIAKQIEAAFLKMVIDGALKLAIHYLGILMGQLSKIGGALGGIFGKIGGILGSGGTSAGGGGAAGGAGGAAGGLGAAAGGVMGAIGAFGSAVSAISGVIGNFQNAHMETSLNAIEHNTRYTMMYVGERADGGILGQLFKMNDILAFGTEVKVMEQIRDMLAAWAGNGYKSGAAFTAGGGSNTSSAVHVYLDSREVTSSIVRQIKFATT